MEQADPDLPGHGEMADAIAALLHDLDSGHGMVMDEGVSYNAQCDGRHHYLYRRDTAAINPKTGKPYSKGRIYAGTLESKKDLCPSYADLWLGKHQCKSGHKPDQTGPGAGHGRAENTDEGGGAGFAPILADGWPHLVARS